MNNQAISETVLLCEKHIERPTDDLRPRNSTAPSANLIEKQLIWSSRKQNDWEILVYKQGEVWDVCFFRWPIHHEHATGSSFDAVRQRAELRIRVLEADRLRATEWRQIIH
jgi:hypothetical protein